jgi:folylpolyglutamate synthase/dihydrofolate synthase
MDYQNTLKYLYESVPMFQQIGGKAYKPGLETTCKLDEHFGHPHRQFKTIHIAGTNGKGSCSHTIAAVLQSAGYRVGLFTSPHLLDFRERIRINGEMIPEEYVVNFVEEHRPFFEPLHPSFFELTTAMAFRYFADRKVDVAVIEVGMGGRLDCTNIIRPDLCVITNIGFDHVQYLGDTLTKIAKEKAGIIKKGVPVVIGRAAGSVKRVFNTQAKEMGAPVVYAEHLKKHYRLDWMTYKELANIRQQLADTLESSKSLQKLAEKAINLDLLEFLSITNPAQSLQALDRMVDRRKDVIAITGPEFPTGIFFELNGVYQAENCFTIISALKELEKSGYAITKADYFNGFGNVCAMTGLMGRWQKLQSYPDIICDTGHNADGIRWIADQLEYIRQECHKNLHIVFGMVNDKDINGVLQLLPKDATYYFTKASVKRALPENELLQLAEKAGLKGSAYPTVADAVRAAQKNCLPKDFIFVGGSNFIVADLLANRDTLNFH